MSVMAKIVVTNNQHLNGEQKQKLAAHWGEWTPALREAEGLPPVEPDSQMPNERFRDTGGVDYLNDR